MHIKQAADNYKSAAFFLIVGLYLLEIYFHQKVDVTF